MTSNRALAAATAGLVAAVLLGPSLLARLLVPGYDGVGALQDGEVQTVVVRVPTRFVGAGGRASHQTHHVVVVGAQR